MKRVIVLLCALVSGMLPSPGWSAGKAGAATEDSQLYFVGSGIASLAGAVFAIRDGHIPGKNIHIFEVRNVTGGSLDAAGTSDTYYVCRGARKYNQEVFQCTWDLMSAVPTLYDPNKTLKDEFFEFNRIHKKDTRARLVDKDGKAIEVKTFGLGWGDRWRMIRLLYTPESWIENRRIDSWFPPSFFRTNFWYVYASMFGFETYSDLVECKRYFRAFLHAFPQMVKGTAEVVTPLNQYDSTVVPITKWLEGKGVDFRMGCRVDDLDLAPSEKEITVTGLSYTQGGVRKELPVSQHDFVFVTNGSMTADSRLGTMSTPPVLERGKLDDSWTLWEKLAAKRPGQLGNPSAFNSHIDQTKWVVYTVTTKDPLFFNLYEKYSGNKPGQTDLLTFKDSNWLMSVHVPIQPHFANQSRDTYGWGGYALLADVEGNYVKKKMAECTGAEILTEICCQMGFEKDLPRILANSTCIPNLSPYNVSHFMPRKRSDRPLVVPEGSTNLAFMGQFTESGECVYLVESSVRCGQMAVYSLLHLDRKVPPAFTKAYNPAALYRGLRTMMW